MTTGLPPASSAARTQVWRDRRQAVLTALLLAVVTALLAYAALAFTRQVDRVAAVWPTNALILATLLRSDQRAWPLLAPAGLVGGFAATLILGDPPVLSLLLALCNGIEILLCATLLRRWSGRHLNLSRKSQFLIFLGLAGGLAPAISAVLAAGFLTIGVGAPFWSAAGSWYAADALGLLTVTPALLALNRSNASEVYERLRRGRGWGSVLVLATVLILVFGQARFPILFLVPPALIYLAFELGLAGAAVGLLVCAVTAVILTLTGHGPAMLLRGDLGERLAVLQLFLATLTMSVFPVAVALSRQAHLRYRLGDALAQTERDRGELDKAHQLALLAEKIGGAAHWRRDLLTGQSVWSRQMYVIHGLPETEGLEPPDVLSLYAPEDQALISDTVTNAGRTGDRFDLKVRLTRSNDGQVRQVVFRGEVERAPDGKAIALFGVMRDVTDEEHDKARLAESEARLRLLTDSASDVLLQVDASDHITYVSPSISRYGYRPEDMIGSVGASYIHPEDLDGVLARVRDLETGLRPLPSQDRSYRMRRADGGYAWIEANSSVVRDAGGEIQAIVCQLRDVSQGRAARLALAESEARYRLLTANATDVIACYGVEAIFTFLSPAIAPMMGYAPDDLIGQPTSRIIHPDDLDMIFARFRAFIAGGAQGVLRFDYRGVHKSGATVWLEAQVKAVLDEAGRVIEFQDVVRDITERKAMEAELAASNLRFQAISQTASDIVSRLAPTGEVLQLSPSILDITGYAPEEIVGRHWVDFLHPEDAGQTLAIFAEIVAGTRRDNTAVGYRARCKDGRWVWLESNPTPMRDDKGVVTELIDVTRDVSARAQLESELRAARDAAEAAADVKASFLANMSHEIRTPLTAILGFTSLLQGDAGLSAVARGRVARIAGAGETLLSTVNDVLDFSKLEAGQVEIVRDPHDPEAVLREALLLFAPQAEAKGLALRLDLPSPLPACLGLDRHRLRQILHNLIGNALKFTKTGQVVLRACYDAPQESLHIAVEDSGAGMTKAQCGKLFQRFSQVDASSTRVHGGTGLGLAICKGLTEAMGGAISVQSKPGKGSVFAFEILAPIAQPEATKIVAPDLADLHGARVLIADDNPVNRELVRAILTPFGVEVADVVDGQQAVLRATAEPFDLLLLDVRMPILSGPEAAEWIRRELGPNLAIPILAFTADVDVEALSGSTGAFDGVVRKPLSPAELVAALAAHLPQKAPLSGITDVGASSSSRSSSAGGR